MLPSIDARSVSLASGFLGLIVSLAMAEARSARKTYPGYGWWAAGTFSFSLGIALLGLQGSADPLFSALLPNVLLVATFLFMNRGLYAFYGSRVPPWVDIAAEMLILAASAFFIWVFPSPYARILVFTAITLAANISLMVAVLGFGRRVVPDPNLYLVVGCIAGTAGAVGRIVLTLVRGPLGGSMMDYPFQGAIMIFYASIYLCISMGLQLLNAQRLEAELRSALERTRRLEGIIPICASCKKIRDDTGAWRQLEAYISEHSDAAFSHGLCPDCLKKLLPQGDD